MSQSFDPPAEQEGSRAIHMDSPLFKAWATECKLVRGPGIITFPDSVDVTFGEAVNASGKAGDGKVVSLGDGGQATLYFDMPISDGPGPDFAVFENSFNDFFLELAFVEVSSDSITFVRFGAVSLTSVDTQVGTFGLLDATSLFNLAGKYRGGYGTPFDLSELQDQPGLDVNHIVCVKVIDVIGTLIDSLASHDSRGVIINDPWPTPFESGGFDLDAVGVIQNEAHLSDGEWTLRDMVIYPNPFKSFLWINIPGSFENIVMVYNIQGQLILYNKLITPEIHLDLESLNQGLYYIVIVDEKGKRYSRIIQKI
ncbi:MAG: hypothetical protein AMS27_04670 [Bacteroides sp. SM23_62_1]|nr:MAG: hypothetical protein AMS27_04670 [Bacteroides sp. SM23_62_1]